MLMSVACRAARLSSPPIGSSEARNPKDGAMAARWIKGWRPGRPVSTGWTARVSPTPATPTAASIAKPAAPTQAIVKPHRSTISSPSGGPKRQTQIQAE